MVQKPVAIGTRSQLFVDDYLVAASSGVVERLHPMEQLPTPVLRAEAAWERPEIGGLWGPVTVHRDPQDGLFRMWYASYGEFPAFGRRVGEMFSCYATSTDGLHWGAPQPGTVSVRRLDGEQYPAADGRQPWTRDAGLRRDDRNRAAGDAVQVGLLGWEGRRRLGRPRCLFLGQRAATGTPTSAIRSSGDASAAIRRVQPSSTRGPRRKGRPASRPPSTRSSPKSMCLWAPGSGAALRSVRR